MAANSVISVTSLDFDAIKSSMKSYISSKQEFTDYNFEGSTISMLLDLLAYNTYQNAFYTSMVGNEMFLDSAQLRESVVSRAKMLDYTTRSARGASCTGTLTVTPDDSPEYVTVEKNTEWSVTIDGVDFKFVTPEEYILSEEDNYSGEISLVEGRVITHRFTVNSNNPTRYIIPNSQVDTTSITINVQNSSEDATKTTYTLASDITEVTADSNVYFLQEVQDKQYEVYFGDDVLGKTPINGNIIIIEYRICNGTLGNNISSFTNPAAIDGYSSFTFTINSATAGGSDIETIDSIKYNAPKNYETQNRAVIAEDYKRLILRDNGDLSSVSVWGGEETIPPIFGKVFIAIKPVSGNVLSSDRKTSLKKYLNSFNVLSIDTEFVDATFLYIRPTITVRYDPDITTLTAGQVQTKILNVITNFETLYLSTFENRKFRYSQFVKAVHDADPSITSCLIDIKLEKRFNPSTSTRSTYNIAFNNELGSSEDHTHTSHAGGHFVESSSFTYEDKAAFIDDDGEGKLRVYYISSTNDREYLEEDIGTVDYDTGLVTLKSFLLSDYSGSHLKIIVKPRYADIRAVRNQILLIAGAKVSLVDENTSATVAVTVEATTTGVSTNVIDTGLHPVVF